MVCRMKQLYTLFFVLSFFMLYGVKIQCMNLLTSSDLEAIENKNRKKVEQILFKRLPLNSTDYLFMKTKKSKTDKNIEIYNNKKTKQILSLLNDNKKHAKNNIILCASGLLVSTFLQFGFYFNYEDDYKSKYISLALGYYGISSMSTLGEGLWKNMATYIRIKNIELKL